MGIAMVVLERRWWLRLVWAALAVVGAAGFAVWYVLVLLPVDLRVAWRTVPELVLAGDIVGLLLALALDAVLKANLAHERAVRRASALTDYQDAMPLARAEGEGQPVPREALEHVEASWPGARRSGWGSLLGMVFTIGIAVYLFVLVTEFMLIFSGVHVPLSLPPSSPPQRQRAVPHVPELIVILDYGGLALMLLSSVLVRLDLIVLIPARVVASAEGITRYSVWGRETFIRWHEVRLLEVAQTRGRLLAEGMVGKPWWYTVYGRDARVRWALRGVPRDGGVDASARLALAVTAHTGLQPRTLAPELMASAEPARPPLLARLTRRSGLVIGLSAVAIGVVALGMTEPDILVLVAFLAIVGVIGLIADGISRRARRRSRERGEGVAAAPVFAPGRVYEMADGRYGIWVFSMISLAVMGAALAVGCGYVLFVGLGLGKPVLGQHPLSLGWTAACSGLTLLGLLLVRGAIGAKQPIVVADDAGVRRRASSSDKFIPWNDIERVDLRPLAVMPSVRYYEVHAGGRKLIINWQADQYGPRRKPYTRGATQLTPEQMAALVAERSGRPIQTAGGR